MDIVSCCTKSGRVVSVSSGDREAGNSVSRRQVITVDSRPAGRSISRLPQSTSIVFPSLGSPSDLALTWRVLHAAKAKKRSCCKSRVEPGLHEPTFKAFLFYVNLFCAAALIFGVIMYLG